MGALQTATAADPVDQVRQLVGTTWYTVSILGQRVGYAYRAASVENGPDGRPALRVVQKMHSLLMLKGMDESLSVQSEATSTYNADLTPIELVINNNEFGRPRKVQARVQGDTIEVVSNSGGAETRETVPKPDDFGTDLQLVLDILAGKARVGYRIEFTTYDPDLGKQDRHVMTVTEKIELQDGREAYVVCSKSSRLPVEIKSVIAADGELMSFSTPSLMQLTVQKASEAEALRTAAPLVLSSEIAADRQIEDARRLDMLKVRLSATTGSTGQMVPATRRQQVQAENGTTVVTVNRHSSVCTGALLPVTDARFASYLSPSQMAQLDDPEVVSKARQIVGEETDARAAAHKIVMWVHDNLQKVKSEPRLVSGREVLQQMSGDCTEHAVLAATLAGAVGIPCKMVAGLAYARGAFYYHAWVELYVGEWVEMDPAWGEPAVDAGHIRLAAGRADMEALANMALTVGKHLGSLKVQILDLRLGQPNAGGPPQGATEE